MSIKLFYKNESPFSRAVALVLQYLKIEHEIVEVDLFKGEHLKPEYTKINPRHKVPFLVDGDLSMGESRAIMAYLHNRYGKGEDFLYPKDSVKRALVDELLYFDATVLTPEQFACLGGKLFGRSKTHDLTKEEAFKKALDFIEARVGDKKFLTGDSCTLADLSVACVLGLSDAVEYDLSSYNNILKLKANVESTIPSFKELTDSGVASLRAVMKANLEKNA